MSGALGLIGALIGAHLYLVAKLGTTAPPWQKVDDVLDVWFDSGSTHAFVLEDPAFMQMYLPAAGVCPANTTQVYRVFSNRPDANHRYMVDRTIRDDMVAVRHWLAEGDGPDLVVMCAPPQNGAHVVSGRSQ